MKNNDSHTNYCLGREAVNHIGLYAGKTEGSLWGWVSGRALVGQAPRSNGTFAGIQSTEYDEIKSQVGSQNPKLREQIFINTVREAETLFPNIVRAYNINNVGKYKHIETVDQNLLQDVVEYIKGSRLMTEIQQTHNKRKVSRVLAKMKKARAAKQNKVAA